MDFEKPYYRRTGKSKQATTSYAKKLARRAMQDKLVVESFDSTPVEAQGEVFVPNITYSLNKAKRWRLTSSEFESTNEDAAVVVVDAEYGISESRAKDFAKAFNRRLQNQSVDTEPETPKLVKQSTTRKDRKHGRVRRNKNNTQLANSYSHEVYQAGSADALVQILRAPSDAKIRARLPENDHQSPPLPRTHKSRALVALEV